MKRRDWTYAVLALVVVLALGIGVEKALTQTRSVSHDAVTTYTDGTPIEPGNAVTYSVFRQDNVTKAIAQVADHSPALSHPFDDSGLVKGRVYNFWGQAHLASGASSDNSAVYAWTLPLGKAAAPAGWVVQ